MSRPPDPPWTPLGLEQALLLCVGAACWVAACGASVSGTALRAALPNLALLAASGCLAGCAPLAYVLACAGLAAGAASPRLGLAVSQASSQLYRASGKVLVFLLHGALSLKDASAETYPKALSLVWEAWAVLRQGKLEELRSRLLYVLGPKLAQREWVACCCLRCLAAAWVGAELGRRAGGWLGAGLLASLGCWGAAKVAVGPWLQAALDTVPVVRAAAGELWQRARRAAELVADEVESQSRGCITPERMLRLCILYAHRAIAKAMTDRSGDSSSDWFEKLLGSNSDSLMQFAGNAGIELLAGMPGLLGKLPSRRSVSSRHQTWMQLLVFCYWLPCALGSDIVKCFLICALVFSAAHLGWLASELRAAGGPPPDPVALWLRARRRPRRLVLSVLIAALGVPATWLLEPLAILLFMPLLLILYLKPELQGFLLHHGIVAFQPLVDCLPTVEEFDTALSGRLTSFATPLENYIMQMAEIRADPDAFFDGGLWWGLFSGLCFFLLGWFGLPLAGALLHLLVCAGLACAGEAWGQGQELPVALQGVAIGLAIFVTVELTIGGYVFFMGPQILHLEAQICLGPWMEDFVGPWLGLLLGPWLSTEAGKHLGPTCRAWLGVFYEPLLGSELGGDVGSTLGTWLGVGLGAWLGHWIGTWIGSLFGVWLAGPVAMLGLPVVWLVVLAVWLQVQIYRPGLALRLAIFDLWRARLHEGGTQRLLILGVDSESKPSAILAATLKTLVPGREPLLVQFLDADNETYDSRALLKYWASQIAQAMVADNETVPMLSKWEEESKVYGLNYEWLPVQQRAVRGSPGRFNAWQAKFAKLNEESTASFRALGVTAGCCLLEGLQLTDISPVLFARLAEVAQEKEEDEEKIDAGTPRGLLHFALLEELCPAAANALRHAAERTASPEDALEFQLPARATAPLQPLRLPRLNGVGGRVAGRLGTAELDAMATAVLENEHVARLLRAFRSGFAAAVGLAELPELLGPGELARLLRGEREVDAEDWERQARYAEGCSGAMAEVRQFWAVVRGLPQEDLQALCQLVTGYPTPPAGGFGALVPPFILTCRREDYFEKSILLYTRNVVELPMCSGGVGQMRQKVASLLSTAGQDAAGRRGGRSPRSF